MSINLNKNIKGDVIMIKVLEVTKEPLRVMGNAASVCYDSIELEDILNNAKVKTAKGIAKHCLKSGHDRVAEFGDVTLLLNEYSARVIREFYVHVIGVSKLQQSTRYVKYDDVKFGYYTPNAINRNEEAKAIYDGCMEYILDNYIQLLDLGIKQEDAGNLLPLGQHTTITCKINIRALEHMFSVRECSRAYEEFRKLMKELRSVLEAIDEDWKYLCDNYFKVKCEKTLYCTESKCCGRYPTKETMEQALKEYKEKLKLEKTGQVV